MKNKKLYLKKILQSFVVILFTVALIMLFNFKKTLTQKIEEKIGVKVVETQIISTYYLSRMDELRRDIDILSALSFSLEDSGEGLEEKIGKIEEIFKSFILAKNNYSKIRIIDRLGNEVVSVERNQGDIISQKKEDLKNKRYREYFKEINNIASDEVYYSSINLNTKDGRLEIPYKPTFRVGRPVLIDGQRYYLIINSDVSWDKGTEEEIFTFPEELMIVNQEGYWVRNTFNPEREWGHSIPERKDEVFERYFPGSWSEIRKNKKGRIETEGRLLLYDTFEILNNKKYYGIVLLDRGYFDSIKKEYIQNFIGNSVQALIVSLLISIVIGVLLGESIEHREKIEKEAKLDLMTGTYNRTYSFKILKEKLGEFRLGRLPLSVVYIDINGLKYINDTLGHHEGDFLIKTVCSIIKENVRTEDALGRVGGDEFILILPHVQEVRVREIMERILSHSKAFAIDRSLGYPISFAYGVVEVTEGFLNTKEILKKADKEMYKMKKLQKNEIVGR